MAVDLFAGTVARKGAVELHPDTARRLSGARALREAGEAGFFDTVRSKAELPSGRPQSVMGGAHLASLAAPARTEARKADAPELHPRVARLSAGLTSIAAALLSRIVTRSEAAKGEVVAISTSRAATALDTTPEAIADALDELHRAALIIPCWTSAGSLEGYRPTLPA